jgi:hypothetical protein
MPVTYRIVPDAVRQVALSGLRMTREDDEADSDPGEALFDQPLEVFILYPSDLVNAEGLASARFFGWRYLVRSSRENSMSMIEVRNDPESPRFSHRQKGWIAAQTQRVATSVETNPELRTQDYTYAVLRVPGLARTDAIWLRSSQQDGGIVIPFASASSVLNLGKLYSENEFLAALRTIKSEVKSSETTDPENSQAP